MLFLNRYTRKACEKEHRVAIVYKGETIGFVGLERVLSFNKAELVFDLDDDVTVIREEVARMTTSKGEKLGGKRVAKVSEEWRKALEKQ